MNLRVQVVVLAILCSMIAFSQNPITADSPFQVKYAANLASGDSVFNLTNTGATRRRHRRQHLRERLCVLAGRAGNFVLLVRDYAERTRVPFRQE